MPSHLFAIAPLKAFMEFLGPKLPPACAMITVLLVVLSPIKATFAVFLGVVGAGFVAAFFGF